MGRFIPDIYAEGLKQHLHPCGCAWQTQVSDLYFHFEAWWAKEPDLEAIVISCWTPIMGATNPAATWVNNLRTLNSAHSSTLGQDKGSLQQ